MNSMLARKWARQSILFVIPLGVLVLLLEFAQNVPEVFPGAHVISVFTRAVTYSVIAALVFHWIAVEIPARRRRRSVYVYNRLTFETLLLFGPASLLLYKAGLSGDTAEFDPWSEESIRESAVNTHARTPEFFGTDRRQMLLHTIAGVQHALDGLAPAQAFLDLDVALALSLFPGRRGLLQLQVDQSETGGVSPGRDAHIVWQLTDAARRLYGELQKQAPYLKLNLGEVVLSSGQVLKVPESYLLKSPDQ